MTTRLNDLKTGHLILIQQRLHESDTTALCLEQGGYQHLYLPEEFEVDRLCKTSIWKDPRVTEGQLLWPAKIGPPEIADLHRKLGSYGYAGQYQQRPFPSGGGIFKRRWFGYWKPKVMALKPVIVKLPDGTMREARRNANLGRCDGKRDRKFVRRTQRDCHGPPRFGKPRLLNPDFIVANRQVREAKSSFFVG